MIHWRNCLTALELASSYCHEDGKRNKWEMMKAFVCCSLSSLLSCWWKFAEIQACQRRLSAFESLCRLGSMPPFCLPFFFFSNLSLLTSWKIEIPPLQTWQHTLDSDKNILEMPVSWSSNKVRSGRISGKTASNPLENNPPFVALGGNNVMYFPSLKFLLSQTIPAPCA